MKLGGWKRLWILLVIIYFPFVVLISVESWQGEYTESYVYEIWATTVLDLNGGIDLGSFSPSWSVMQKYKERRYSAKEFIEEMKEVIKKESPQRKKKFKTIQIRYEKQLENLKYKQLMQVGIYSLIWVVPSVLLYLLGLGIGWVYKGFKS